MKPVSTSVPAPTFLDEHRLASHRTTWPCAKLTRFALTFTRSAWNSPGRRRARAACAEHVIAGRECALYSPGLMYRGASEAPFRHRHLLGIEGLSPDDINHVLDLADGYVELNRQAEKKHGLLRGGTIINLLLRELDAHPHLVRGSPASGSAAR
jgi:hypothetical protein